MYKCTECGLEFDIKPEYCDCGNDEFVLTVTESTKNITEKHDVQTAENSEYNNKSDYNYTFSKSENIKPSITLSSIIISIFCLILSFIIIFVWNPMSEPKTIPQNNTEETVIQIPSINKLWKDPISNSDNSTRESKSINTTAVSPIKTIQKQKNISVNKIMSMPISKIKANNIKPASQPNTKLKQSQATQQNARQINTTTSSVNATKISEEAKKAEDLQKEKEAKQKAEAEAIAAANSAKKAASLKQEYLNYKISLRNTLAKKIDFTKVIGDGNCIVTFQLDSNGKLINRVFAKQSSNLTLNNAVYKAILATPTYTKPPLGYKNETLKLNISFYNGNYAITLE